MNQEIRFYDMEETPPIPGKHEKIRRVILILENRFKDVFISYGKMRFGNGQLTQIFDVYEMGEMAIQHPPVENSWLKVLAWANAPKLPKRYKYK